MSRLDEAFLDQVRQRTDIVDLIGEYVRLEKRGGRYWGICPFHSEKTPSFTVVPERQFYYCFGCKATGDALRFLMEKDHLEFGEAVAVLARRANLPLPEVERSPVEEQALAERRQLLSALDLACRYYEHQLHNSAAGQRVLAYLNRRRVAPATAQRFRLGYAPDGWDNLQQALRQKVSPDVLVRAGLLSPRDRDGGGSGRNGYYDRFRQRLMFPIADLRGRILAFGGRALAEGQSPKYYNSPEGRVYSKREHLYALHLAKEAMRSGDRAILVEGYMDAIALHQAGFHEAVASLGTALTPAQVDLLRRQAGRVYIAYDADLAGQQATLKGLDLLDRAGCQVLVVQLPAGRDPDELVGEDGPEAFSTVLTAALPLIDFKLQLALRQNADAGNAAEAKAAAVQAVLAVLAGVPDEVRRSEYLRKVAATLNVRDEALYAEFHRYVKGKQEKEPSGHNQSRNWNNIKVLDTDAAFRVSPSQAVNRGLEQAERHLLQHLLQRPEWIAFVQEQLGTVPFQHPVHAAVWQGLVGMAGSAPGADQGVSRLLHILTDEDARTLVAQLEVQPLPSREPDQEVRDCVRTIQRQHLQAKREELDRRLLGFTSAGPADSTGSAGSTGAAEYRKVLQDIMAVDTQLRSLEKRR